MLRRFGFGEGKKGSGSGDKYAIQDDASDVETETPNWNYIVNIVKDASLQEWKGSGSLPGILQTALQHALNENPECIPAFNKHGSDYYVPGTNKALTNVLIKHTNDFALEDNDDNKFTKDFAKEALAAVIEKEFGHSRKR